MFEKRGFFGFFFFNEWHRRIKETVTVLSHHGAMLSGTTETTGPNVLQQAEWPKTHPQQNC